jgi:uncharacterized protein YwqG
LFLLAQLNLAQLPPLAGFPTKGIIQFFIAAGDTHGMDFADFTQGAGHAVLYWPDAPAVNDGLDYHPDTPDLAAPIADLAVPFVTQRAVKLVGEVSPTALSLADFRFASQADRLVMTEPGRWPVLEAWRRAPANAALSPADLEDDSARGHRLGGHPWFTVDDPRSRPVYTGFTTLLLQLDTDDEAGLAWGERGVCHFFIEPERLAALDFSCVLYHWDSC